MTHMKQVNIVRALMAGALSLALLPGACATIQDKPTTDSIMLDKPVHFLAPDGNDVICETARGRLGGSMFLDTQRTGFCHQPVLYHSPHYS